MLRIYEPEPEYELPPRFRYTFAKCPRCESSLLAVQEEDFPEGWQAPARLFPAVEYWSVSLASTISSFA